MQRGMQRGACWGRIHTVRERTFGAHRQGQLPSSSTNWRKVRHRMPNKTSCCTVTVSRQPASPPSTDRSIVFASWRQYVPRSNARFTGPTQVRLHRTASRSIQPLLHGSRACNVTNNRSDRQTDRPRYVTTWVIAQYMCWIFIQHIYLSLIHI